MTLSGPPRPGARDIVRLLEAHLGQTVRNIAPLGEGMWSRAFAFDCGGRSLVVRFGEHEEDFLKDRIAASWSQPGLPVPTFLSMGGAFDTYFAITERAHGQFLDLLPPTEAARVMPSLVRVLEALRQVPVGPESGFGGWNGEGVGEHVTWRDAVRTVETRRPEVTGWRVGLREWPDIERIFDRGLDRLHSLAETVPSRQDVVHRDWLNRNVLVTGSTITSVFDWGSSIYGDHLYDVAWLTFCASYSTGFDRDLLRSSLRNHFVGAGIDAGDFDSRVDCYELHIGLSALIYRAFLRKRDEADYLAGKILDTLDGSGRRR